MVDIPETGIPFLGYQLINYPWLGCSNSINNNIQIFVLQDLIIRSSCCRLDPDAMIQSHSDSASTTCPWYWPYKVPPSDVCCL